MKEFKIKKVVTGNCECATCRIRQAGLKCQPYTVWWKDSGEKRGHNEPVCSKECALKYVELHK